jgi:hypothetical protein
MATFAVLIVVVGVLGFVLYWSGRHGDPNRNRGTSLKRGASANTTRNGQPKKAYATREEAQAQAQRMTEHDGSPMSAYKCATCDKWHVGH